MRPTEQRPLITAATAIELADAHGLAIRRTRPQTELVPELPVAESGTLPVRLVFSRPLA